MSLDIGIFLEGYCGDTATSFVIGGKATPEQERLMKAGRDSLEASIQAALLGHRLGDVSYAMQKAVEDAGFNVVREYGGHGIGYTYHEDPIILNYRNGSRTKLKAGMVVAIEPMFNAGGDRVRLKPDNWTVVTTDYKPSAHFEHSLLIIEGAEPEVLTRRPSEEI